MNTPIALIALVAALASTAAPALLAAPQHTQPIIFRVRNVQQDGAMVIKPGDSSTKVLGILGRPLERMAKDVWTYPNFHAVNNKDAERQACSTLVITFENDRVAAIALVNRRAAKIVADHIRTDPRYLNDRLLAMK